MSSKELRLSILRLLVLIGVAGQLALPQAGPTAWASNDNLRDRIKIRKKIRLQRSQPDESEEYNQERQAVLAKKRRGLIEDIKRFIRDARDSNQKAELNLRLGGLFLEEYYHNLSEAQVTFDRAHRQWKENGKKGREPRFDNSAALAALDKARLIYKDLVRRFRRHPRRDEMLYFLALTSLDRGKVKEGMGYFQQLTNEVPNSKYVNDALVQLGDHYFDNNDFNRALIQYEKLLKKRYRPLMAYATYKKAWCLYNRQDTENALDLFRWVILNEREMESEAPVKVRNEALRDITLPFVDLKRVNDSISFFKQFGNPTFRDSLATMASLYFEQGNYPQAIQMYQYLLKLDPNHRDNPNYDLNVVESYMQLDRRDQAVARLFERLPIYARNSTWYEINAAQPKVVQTALESFEKAARKYAFRLHAEGQKTKNARLYDSAKDIYAKYIQYFPNSPEAAKVRFYLAEILFKVGEYPEAALHYWLVYKDPSAGKLRLDSIRYALTALDRQLNMDRKKQGLGEINSKSSGKLNAEMDKKLELIPYSKVEAQFLTIAAEYLTKFPKQKDAPDVLYEQSYLRYVHHELVPAYKGFWILVQKYPKHETALSAAYLILDVLNRSKDYPKLITACKKFLATPSFTKKAFRSEVEDILRRAELKRIQMAEEQGKFKEAAEMYVEYTKAYGGQDVKLFETALYNASVNFTKANMLLQAVEAQERFLRRFPKSKLVENMLLQVADTYESLANFDKAAKYFEEFADRFPRNPQAKNALRLAGLYHWGSGKLTQAEKAMRTYMARYPADSALAQRDLIDMYTSEGSDAKLAQFYDEIRAGRGVSFASYLDYSLRMAELQGKRTGQIPVSTMKQAMGFAQKHRATILKSPEGVEALAKLMFWFTRHRDQEFTSIPLKLPQAALERNVQRKIALLQQLEREYAQVASLGSGEWGLASLYRTAAAYRHMAQAILTAPVPAELTGEQLEMYRAELSKQMILPFNEKALSLAEQCLDKSQELNLLSIWTPKCYALAGQLREKRYPLARTFYLPPLRTSVMIPRAPDSKLAVGGMKRYAYPFYSSSLFENTRSAGLAAMGVDLPALYAGGLEEQREVIPSSLSYRVLSDERRQVLASALKASRPGNPTTDMNFAYLNVVRILAPQKAAGEILKQIEADPKNEALHNLLGLAYLEAERYPAAKVTWLAMIARGVRNAAVWNNLGVLAYHEGNETQAIEYFQEALLNPQPLEAYSNLGFVALKYRNGFEAKKHFQKLLELENDDVPAQVGLATAQLQNREIDNAKENLVGLAKRYRNDPYARLSLSYYLMDVEKQNDLAQRILADYMDTQSVERDLVFRKAVQEARTIAGAADGSDLPDIE